MAPYEALYGRKCRSPIHWEEVGERATIRPQMFQHSAEMVAMIRERMKTAQSRLKRYADQRRQNLEFAVGDHVFVKIAPMKRVVRFGKKVKLSRRFIGPFEILEKVGAFAYRVVLPLNLRGQQCLPLIDVPQFTPNLSYEENPTQILGRHEKRLRNKMIKMVKVKWLNHSEEEATWNAESEMRIRYHELFGAS
ncbi:uncharacterized protein LOC142532256 [Primulina tabacum]|uniref:uncharacterized protein LOC142532256 n=1 Tax=Primulina tabacum TaxID=48773 RepID=UPI003F59DA6C